MNSPLLNIPHSTYFEDKNSTASGFTSVRLQTETEGKFN